ncbi:MAG: carboxypeptidase regulatory-like domain-containing protein, partial [Acidobacteria bacterium]|nr:carboxypeptidase regulatory-like domain-containing protein [Acidobacteriota bacterium]
MGRGRAIVVWARALLVALPSFVCPAAAEIILHGRVVDENQAPVAGAQITVSQAGAASQRVLSDPTGAFVVPLPALGEYQIRAEREGHFQLEQTVEVQEDESELTLTLPYQRERVESLDVSYSPPAVDP